MMLGLYLLGEGCEESYFAELIYQKHSHLGFIFIVVSDKQSRIWTFQFLKPFRNFQSNLTASQVRFLLFFLHKEKRQRRKEILTILSIKYAKYIMDKIANL